MAKDKNIKNLFDGMAHQWAQRAYDSKNTLEKFPSSKVRHTIAIAEIIKRKKKGFILDMGCASGELVIDLLKLGYDVEGFDISPEMVKTARANLLEEKSLTGRSKKETFRDASFRSFASRKKFDVITAMGFTEYLDSDNLFFKKTKSLLKNKGYVIVDFRNALFNLFTANNYTEDIFQEHKVHAYIKEFKDLERFSPLSLHEVSPIVVKTFKDIYLKLSQVNKSQIKKKGLKYRLINTQINIKQSTPKKVKEIAEKHNLHLESVIYYHFHPFLPAFEKHFPILFNSIGLAMQPLGYTPLGASTCSSFVAVFKHGYS